MNTTEDKDIKQEFEIIEKCMLDSFAYSPQDKIKVNIFICFLQNMKDALIYIFCFKYLKYKHN